jgi:hypothetical protein
LNADVSEAGAGWSDGRIIQALGTNPSTVCRARKQLAEEGLDAALCRKAGASQPGPRYSTGGGRAADRTRLFAASRRLVPAPPREQSGPTRHRRAASDERLEFFEAMMGREIKRAPVGWQIARNQVRSVSERRIMIVSFICEVAQSTR